MERFPTLDSYVKVVGVSTFHRGFNLSYPGEGRKGRGADIIPQAAFRSGLGQ